MLLASSFIFLFGFLVSTNLAAVQIKNYKLDKCLVYNGTTPVLSSLVTFRTCGTSTKVWTQTRKGKTSNYLYCVNSACLAVGTGNLLYFKTKNSADTKQLFSIDDARLYNNYNITAGTGTSKCAEINENNGNVKMVTCLYKIFSTDTDPQTFVVA